MQPLAPHQPTRARLLIQPEQRQQQAHPPGMGEEREDERAVDAVAQRARRVAFDLGAGRLDQLVVAHAGRAGGDAGHAAEAGVEVAAHLRRQANLAIGRQPHQVDASARRVHLLAPEQPRRAGGQAEAAMHAILDDLAGGRMVCIEGACGGCSGRIGAGGEFSHQMPPTKRPGLSVLCGSNCALTRRIRSSAAGVPHGSIRPASVGAYSSTTSAPRAASAACRSACTVSTSASGWPASCARIAPWPACARQWSASACSARSRLQRRQPSR